MVRLLSLPWVPGKSLTRCRSLIFFGVDDLCDHFSALWFGIAPVRVIIDQATPSKRSLPVNESFVKATSRPRDTNTTPYSFFERAAPALSGAIWDEPVRCDRSASWSKKGVTEVSAVHVEQN